MLYYTASFDFGTPPQRQELIVDTGSSWVWTWADECPDPNWDSQCRKTVGRFHTLNSETLSYTGATQYVEYGIGTSQGPVCKDVVSFAGS